MTRKSRSLEATPRGCSACLPEPSLSRAESTGMPRRVARQKTAFGLGINRRNGSLLSFGYAPLLRRRAVQKAFIQPGLVGTHWDPVVAGLLTVGAWRLRNLFRMPIGVRRCYRARQRCEQHIQTLRERGMSKNAVLQRRERQTAQHRHLHDRHDLARLRPEHREA